MSKTHIFGELDLDLSKGPGKIWDEVFRISELCGYYPSLDNNQILVAGSDNDHATITFGENGKVKSVHHYATNDEGGIIIPVHELKI